MARIWALINLCEQLYIKNGSSSPDLERYRSHGALMFGFLKKLFTTKAAVPTAPPVPAAPPVSVTPDGFVAHDDDLLINAYCSTNTLPALDFPHLVQGRRSLADPALAEHLRGFAGWVNSVSSGEMTQTRYHVLRHIEKVRNHVSLLVHPADMERFAAWAKEANAIAFFPNGFICDPAGAVLLSPGGTDDHAEAAVPYPPSAQLRKARTEDLLANRSLKAASSLPPVIAESEVVLRSATDIAERIMALFAVAVRAETLASKSPMASDEILLRVGLSEHALSPDEYKFIVDRIPTKKDVVHFGWCYECAFTLAWAVGVIDKLPFPGATCDVELIAQKLLKLGKNGLQATAKVRPVSEILDSLDLHQRLHWIVRQAQVDKKTVPRGLEPGVILERHRALNWLVQFEGAQWDDVDTPT
jgi:hypothetical protein